MSDVFWHQSRTGKSYCRTRYNVGSERVNTRKGLHYPLNRRLSGSQEPVWTFQRREKSLAPSGIQIPDSPAHSLVTIPECYYGFWVVVMKTEKGGKHQKEQLNSSGINLLNACSKNIIQEVTRIVFLVLSFCRVLNEIWFLLGVSSASQC
jgi:hypothetical protein